MWVCKFCGCTEFDIERKIIDRDFDSKKNTLNINDIKRSVMCCNCYNWGKYIEEIAYWEDEYERD
nr:MAG TPA: nucleic-acid-binding protein [Caudoviricetes sp.]